MNNKKTFSPSDLNEDEPAFVKDRWYMFMAPGGFTLIGQYVKPLGMSAHRFKHCTHLRNAGGKYLPVLCREGPGPDTKFVGEFPGFWNGTPLQWTDYFGHTPWVKNE